LPYKDGKPFIDEQIAIANILTDMDKDVAALEQKLAKYEAIKKGMMQELLTGKIRLV
jgi:type I restriction enzyme S subunit